MATSEVIGRLRAICLALPETEERPFGGHTSPAFRVRDRMFAVVSEDGEALTVKAGPGVQEALVGADPDRYFVPKYVGSKGWVGIRLDGRVDVDDIAELVEDSYRLIAPKRLAARLD